MFDLKNLEEKFRREDEKELISIAYSYDTEITYIKEENYEYLISFVNCVLKNVYCIKNRNIQEAFFDVVINVININYGKIQKLENCIKNVKKIIEEGQIDDWELAESLLIISSTFDRSYIDIMKKYENYGDEYVREVVEEYLYDMSN